MVDIKLRQWAEQALPAKAVESGWDALQKEFKDLMAKAKRLVDHDDIFDNLKTAVIEEAIKRHAWEDKAIDMLRVIQLNTLEDRNVHDKQEWDQAVKFFEISVKEKLASTEQTIQEMFGPTATQKWVHWRSTTDDQNKRKSVKSELDKILNSETKHQPMLSYDELTTVKKNLQRSNIEVETDYIRETWYPIYRRHFLRQALARAYDCKKAYFLYTQQGTECEVSLPRIPFL